MPSSIQKSGSVQFKLFSSCFCFSLLPFSFPSCRPSFRRQLWAARSWRRRPNSPDRAIGQSGNRDIGTSEQNLSSGHAAHLTRKPDRKQPETSPPLFRPSFISLFLLLLFSLLPSSLPSTPLRFSPSLSLSFLYRSLKASAFWARAVVTCEGASGIRTSDGT